MKKKIFYLLSVMLFMGFGFVLTSKSPESGSVDYCTQPNLSAKIRVIPLMPNDRIGEFRAPGYASHTPSPPDLRMGPNIVNDAAPHLADYNKFYCSVTVTASRCSNWKWFRVMDASNTTNDGVMNIELPPDGAGDAIVEVNYYERASGLPFQFNKVPNSRIKYTAKKIYVGRWGSTIPEPIWVYPTEAPIAFVALGPGDGDVSSKSPIPTDLGGINQYIDINIPVKP